MSKYRTLSEKNKYYLPKHTYLMCIHYALQYRDWKASLDADRDTRGAIRYDKDKVQITNDFDSTSETAMRMIEYDDKCKAIDKVINIACDYSSLNTWIRLGVCYGFTFSQLKQMDIPCEKDMYYRIRQRFYYELSKIIKIP